MSTIDMIGKTYGMLKVLNQVKSKGKPKFQCQCSCGTITEKCGYDLRAGRSFSCGCVRRSNIGNHTKVVVSEVSSRAINLFLYKTPVEFDRDVL